MEFDVEKFLNSKSQKGDINPKKAKLLFQTPLKKVIQQNEKSMPSPNLSLSYTNWLKINEEHEKYINNLHLNVSAHQFINILCKTELTGAKLKLKNGDKIIEGIVTQERENIFLIILPDNKIKKFPKNDHVFSLQIKNIKYLLIGKFLKKNRFLKK
ncbi:RNase P subunit Rpp29 [Spraguea lophii 42_110]|uniref:RNase P subunit Rpp29 n=1 Tax=Spraguea lophii (strain 42_110) TaxID=1358809 RepID=S7WB85_SPRLO|nr:RNase P subunit Rpp29 [Spraguea lophii 42_110]